MSLGFVREEPVARRDEKRDKISLSFSSPVAIGLHGNRNTYPV